MFVYHAAKAPFDYADEYVLQRNPRSDFGQKLYLSLTFDDANHYADYSGRDWILIYEIPGCGDIAGLPGLAAFKGLSFHSFGSKTEFSPDDANGFLWGSTILANRLGIDSGRGMAVADVMFGPRADVHTNEVLNSFRNQYESGSWNPSDD